MKTAVHYAMTPEGDEVWVILTPAEHAGVADCLELAAWGELKDVDGRRGPGVIAVFSRTALRAASRFVDGKVERCGGPRDCPRELAELQRRLRYESDRLRRAEQTPETVFVAEARAGLPTGQEA